jgi:hypothetical protein
MTDHYCGQLSLIEAAQENARGFLWGTLKAKEEQQLIVKVKQLTTQLEKARAISAGRLAKLKTREAKGDGDGRAQTEV